MKTVKEYGKNGFKVVIKANFIKDGDYDFGMKGRWTMKDIVYIQAFIYSDLSNLEKYSIFDTKAYNTHEIIKERFFRGNITKPLTIHNHYEKQLKKLISDVEKHIDKVIFERKITDGLPDSLIDLS